MPVIEAYVKATITTPGEPPTKATQVDVIFAAVVVSVAASTAAAIVIKLYRVAL